MRKLHASDNQNFFIYYAILNEKGTLCVCVWIVSSHISILLNGCGCHMPVKSKFKMLLMGECRFQERERLAVMQTWLLMERILRVPLKKLEMPCKLAGSNRLDPKDLGRLSEWITNTTGHYIEWIVKQIVSWAREGGRKGHLFVLPMKQAERGQPNIRLGEPQFLVYMQTHTPFFF